MKNNLKVSDIGEKKLIAKVIKPILEPAIKPKIFQIGDDAAVIDIKDENHYFLASTDKLSEKPLAFEEGIMNYYDLGYLLCVANLSDIAAMGGKPVGFLFSLGVPRDFKLRDLRALVHGVKKAAVDHKTSVLGGDTGCTSVLSLCGTSLGIVPKDELLSRFTANAGDLIFVTNYPGLFLTSLYYFLSARKRGFKLTDCEEKTLLNVLIRPKAKIEEGRMLAKSKQCTSCMDLTDGLAMSSYELSHLSKISFKIFSCKLPIHPITYKVAEFEKIDPVKIALGASADFELFGTIKNEEIVEVFKKKNKKITIIGETVPYTGKNYIIREDGKTEIIQKSGWEHFIGNAREIILDHLKK
jgi:thiamine-monophosphate kinase